MHGNVERVARVIKQVNLAFVHAGRLFDPDALVSDLREHIQTLGFHVLLVDIETLAAFVGEGSPEEAVILYDIGRIVGQRMKCQLLGNARAALMRRLEHGSRVILVSSAPRSRLLGCPGSQLLMDAAPCFTEPIESEHLQSLVDDLDLSLSAQRIGSLTARLPKLVYLIIGLVRKDEESSSLRQAANDALEGELTEAVRELGPDIASTLDYLLIELAQARYEHYEIDPFVLEGVRGAGLATSQDGWSSLHIGFDGPLRGIFLRALRNYVDTTTDLPTGYEQAVLDLWYIERSLRAEVRGQAIIQHGKAWKERLCPSGVAERILSRASFEAYPGIVGIADLPNPIEWMTLGELLDVATSNQWARPWGLQPAFWTQFKTTVAPVRDRLAHMRLLRAGDVDEVRRWRRQIEKITSKGPSHLSSSQHS